jgi:hypothetical protein
MMLFRKTLFILACSLLIFLSPLSSLAQKGQSQTKRTISIELTNADVCDVLRLIAEVGNVNIIVGDDVKGRITLKLTNVALGSGTGSYIANPGSWPGYYIGERRAMTTLQIVVGSISGILLIYILYGIFKELSAVEETERAPAAPEPEKSPEPPVKPHATPGPMKRKQAKGEKKERTLRFNMATVLLLIFTDFQSLLKVWSHPL